MDVKALFEAVDKNIMTDDMLASLQESFDKAVDDAAEDKAEAKAAEIAGKKIEEEKEAIEKEAEEKLEEYKKYTTEKISEYIEIVAEEYIKKNQVSIEESIKIAQLDALMEGFESMLTATGVELRTITERTENSVVTAELSEMKAKVNSLVESNSEYKRKNAELLKMNINAELSEGLSFVQKEKLSKLTEMISFDSEDFGSYISKVTALKESVLDAAGTKGGSEEPQTTLEESVTSKAKAWKRFV